MQKHTNLGALSPTQRERSRSVSVINDDATQRATLAGLLEEMGCEVEEFASAEEALGTFSVRPPELIVTDLHMPGLDGWRLCRLLRSPEFAVCNDLPILVVSATFSGDEPQQLTAGMGANAFLPSPVEGGTFQNLVRQLLAGQVSPIAPRVLVVDDEPEFAATVVEAFALHGCQVTSAHTGAEARQKLRAGRFDSVVLDHHLPDMKGEVLLAEIQALPSAPAVVMMTGDVDPKLALRFVKLGARAYARKPFELEYLISLCDSAWRERCLLRVEDLLEQRTRQLRESDERLRVMAENAPSMMLLVDAQHQVHQANRAALEFSRHQQPWCPGILYGKLLNCARSAEDLRGCGVDAHCASCPLTRIVQEVIRTGRPHSRVEIRLTVRSSGRPTEVALLASAARVEVAAQPMALLCLEDVSTLRQIEEQLRQAQKMEAVGQLAGGIAHDFNNILAAMSMQLGLLKLQGNVSPEVTAALELLETSANRAATLTRQLLAFSRRQMMQVKPLDLNQLVVDLLKMLRRLLGEHIELTFQGSPARLWIDADASMIEQVVMNLCVNARDAMPQGGRLTISTNYVDIDAEVAQHGPLVRAGKYACLSVADTGSGMDEETQQRIFEPFFTTKDVGKGTGLGLATAYGIVRQHSGWFEVESQPGKGSLFRVLLPARNVPPSPAPSAPGLGYAWRGTETILLVEDEELVRRLAARCLAELGYRVLQAATGAEALKRWNEQAGRVDLLLTDEVMPQGMSGIELAERLQQLDPELKVILCSGYSLEMQRAPTSLGQNTRFLAKPYQVPQLAALVRECLD